MKKNIGCRRNDVTRCVHCWEKDKSLNSVKWGIQKLLGRIIHVLPWAKDVVKSLSLSRRIPSQYHFYTMSV